MRDLLRPAAATWLRLPPNTRGAIWILLYTSNFAAADALAKLLAKDMSIYQIAFVRYAISLVLLAPVVLHLGLGTLRTTRPVMHVIRATLSNVSQILVYFALTRMALADATAITFTRPLFVVVLAVVFLRERVSWQRGLATAVGFSGVLFMVPTSGPAIDLGALSALASALVFASVLVMVRFYSSEPPIRFIVYYHAIGAIMFLPPAVATWTEPSADHYALLALTAVLATCAQTCGIRAYHVGMSSVVGPFEYSRLLFAAVIGYLMFAEFPDALGILGAAIIVACTLYNARRQAYEARTAATGDR